MKNLGEREISRKKNKKIKTSLTEMKHQKPKGKKHKRSKSDTDSEKCKKIIKKERKYVSDDDYDSEKYEKSNMAEYSDWDYNIDGQKIKMHHLRFNVSVPYEKYKTVIKERPEKFRKNFANCIWTESELKERAFRTNTTKRASKPFTPCKKKVFRDEYFKQIDKRGKKDKKKDLKKNWKKHLGKDINNMLQNEKRMPEKNKTLISSLSESDSDSSSVSFHSSTSSKASVK